VVGINMGDQLFDQFFDCFGALFVNCHDQQFGIDINRPVPSSLVDHNFSMKRFFVSGGVKMG